MNINFNLLCFYKIWNTYDRSIYILWCTVSIKSSLQSWCNFNSSYGVTFGKSWFFFISSLPLVKSRCCDGEHAMLYRVFTIVPSRFHHRTIAISSSCHCLPMVMRNSTFLSTMYEFSLFNSTLFLFAYLWDLSI
jgi:hypothetical protein